MPSTFNIHEAKTQLSRLVERAAAGESIVIAKAGKARVRLVPAGDAAPEPRRLGFMAGRARLPADPKAAFAEEVAAMFQPR
jgi:prevent-host-death family protein